MPSYKPPKPDSKAWKAIDLAGKLHVVLLRVSGGRIGAKWGKAGILVLHHVGAKSGTERTVPLVFGHDGDNLVIIASRGGSDRNPAWYHNLLAHPDVTVDLPREDAPRPVHARVVEGEERERLYEMMVELYKGYDTYRQATDRHIPVLLLEPR